MIGNATVPLLTLHGLVTVGAVLCYVITSHVMHQRRHPAAAIAWMLFILLLPYLALPAFLMFGSRKLARPRGSSPRVPPATHTSRSWAVQTILALGGPTPAAYCDLRLHADGRAARDALFAVIDAARQSIDLCIFILARDALGQAVLERLIAKARSGVRVRLLLDGAGILMARRPRLRPLLDAGAAYTLFVPPLLSPVKGASNLRNHRKMLIADAEHEGAKLWCGGRNLAEEYFAGHARQAPWRDLTFDVGGPLVQQAQALFNADWAFANGQPLAPIGLADATIPSAIEGAQLIASGPDQLDDTVYAMLVTAAYRARHRIALVTPYFVPDPALLMALCLAARRGVTVDLLLPERSNHRLSDLARARALRTLVQAGGRVWLAPHMVHAKLAVIDDELALAGSANLDTRSLFMNYELMMAFHARADVQGFGSWFAIERSTAHAYTATRPGLLRDVGEGMLLWLAFQL